ncbi:MAG: dUTP diphosphatase [Candidatus Hodarchaeales archaeon]|jgi:deoxyuridine 5'-triphosphate nucleotidohydrolase
MYIKIRKINELAKLPKKHSINDAAYDLFSIEDIMLASGQTSIINTGICMEIPAGYYGQIQSRSSIALKGIFITGGVIDSGYRGEIMVITNNISSDVYKIKKGDRVAQIVFHKVNNFDLIEVDSLDEDNDRGGGFGSSDS